MINEKETLARFGYDLTRLTHGMEKLAIIVVTGRHLSWTNSARL